VIAFIIGKYCYNQLGEESMPQERNQEERFSDFAPFFCVFFQFEWFFSQFFSIFIRFFFAHWKLRDVWLPWLVRISLNFSLCSFGVFFSIVEVSVVEVEIVEVEGDALKFSHSSW